MAKRKKVEVVERVVELEEVEVEEEEFLQAEVDPQTSTKLHISEPTFVKSTYINTPSAWINS